MQSEAAVSLGWSRRLALASLACIVVLGLGTIIGCGGGGVDPGSMPFRVERNDLISSWPERTDGRADG